MKRILDHLWLNHQKKVRFLLVGLWNTIFGYLVFVGLDYLFNLFFSPRYVAYMSAAVLSNIIAVTLAYFFHKHFTFVGLVKSRRTALFENLYSTNSVTYKPQNGKY